MNRRRYRKKFGNKFRWTNPRQDVIDIFIETEKHLSADEVYIKLQKKASKIGIATVYRNLEFLTEQGILKRYQFGDGKARYELHEDDAAEHHHHLICENCGDIINYSKFVEREKKLIKDLEKELSDKFDFKIDTHQLHFYGKCKKCVNKKGGD